MRDLRQRAALVARQKRAQPVLPYRPISPRRLQQECRRRLRRLGIRGPRAYELVAVLVQLFPTVQSGIVFKGDLKMGDAMQRCSKTAHRGKYDLLRAGIITLHCAGPRMCPCATCGGVPAGGTILNSRGQMVSAATGYQIDPELLKTRRANGPKLNSRAVESPALTPQEGLERLRAMKERLAARAGP